MKKQLICLLTICLLLTCFTACGQQKVTVTQTNTPPVTEDVVSVEQQISSVESEPEQANKTESSSKVSTNDNKPQATVSTSLVASAGSSQPTQENQAIVSHPEQSQPNAQATSTPILSGNSNGVDQQKVWPTFTSFATFENWLANGGKDQDVHDSMTKYATNAADFKAGYYYRPVFCSQNDFIKFKDIEFCSNKDLTHIYYRYDIIETTNISVDLQIWVDLEPYALDIDSGNLIKELKYPENQRSFDNYSITTYNGIKYYAFYYSDYKQSYIYWGQYNKVFCADMYGDFDQLDQILPLLQVEKVSFKANDQVTQ